MAKIKGIDNVEKDIKSSLFRGLLKCDCSECPCNMFVEEDKWIEQGGLCGDCTEGNHEDIC